MSEKSKVIVVDDTQEVIDAISWLIESVGYEVIAFSDPHQFIKALPIPSPSCLVLDIRMPGLSGLEIQEVLNSRQSSLPIIFITGHGDVPMAVEAMKLGAVDFLTKPLNNQKLLDAINKGLRISHENLKHESKRKEFLKQTEQLTSREEEVMALLVKGYSSKKIALELKISHHTVELHRAKVLRKMQCANQAKLVKMVMSSECA